MPNSVTSSIRYWVPDVKPVIVRLSEKSLESRGLWSGGNGFGLMLATENRSKVELLGVVIPLPIIETEVLVDDVTVAVGISGSENQNEKMKEREN